MPPDYTVTEGRRLRRGRSTGSCAAAAAKAATMMLFSGIRVEAVSITAPVGIKLDFAVKDIDLEGGQASCAVKKDAGDDPDITDGMDIYARAVQSNEPGVKLTTGPGVGLVTRPGLQVAVGRPAINPVPEKMILKESGTALPEGQGVIIEISIPDGERLAKKTLNGRLGIKGGLSILGTSGLVEPMSEQSYKETLAMELRTVRYDCAGPVCLVTGNYGRELAREHFMQPDEAIVKIGNLVGFSLDRCLELEFTRILLIGHIGKLIKVTAGIFNTHSRVADARFEIFAARAAELGAGPAIIARLREMVTTEDMVEILEGLGGAGLFNRLAAEVSDRSEAYLFNQVKVGTVLFNFRRGLLGKDEEARRIMEEF